MIATTNGMDMLHLGYCSFAASPLSPTKQLKTAVPVTGLDGGTWPNAAKRVKRISPQPNVHARPSSVTIVVSKDRWLHWRGLACKDGLPKPSHARCWMASCCGPTATSKHAWQSMLDACRHAQAVSRTVYTCEQVPCMPILQACDLQDHLVATCPGTDPWVTCRTQTMSVPYGAAAVASEGQKAPD
jgi:hypothetical protein